MPSVPCKVCNASREKYYGVVVNSLEGLRIKGIQAFGYSAGTAVTVVLNDDGTIVEDKDYFLCLPKNTNFMILQDTETWTPANTSDKGTSWLQSYDMGSDTVDSSDLHWRRLAAQLKQHMASIILMSEEDLEILIAAPCAGLASALAIPEEKTRNLQDALQNVLDRKEQERQSKELLQLYLSATERELMDASNGEAVPDEVDGTEVDTTHEFARTLQVLKSKTKPETRLSNAQLQMVVNQTVETMMGKLCWDKDPTEQLLLDCKNELSKRLQQVQAMQTLNAYSQCSSSNSTTEQHKEKVGAKRRK